MSEIEIGSGGRVRVSVPLLREQAAVLRGVRDRLYLIAESLARAAHEAAMLGASSAYTVRDAAYSAASRGAALSAGLEQAADTYEYAEWMVATEAHRAVDLLAARTYDGQLADAAAKDPADYDRARQLVDGRGLDPLAEVGHELLAGRVTPFGLIGAFMTRMPESARWLPAKVVSAPVAGSAFLPGGLRLPSTSPAVPTGSALPGVVSPVATGAAVAATRVSAAEVAAHPMTLEAMVSQVRAEVDMSITSYEFAGHREHIVAIDGTEFWSPIGSDDVLDLGSNLELFLAQESSLRTAIEQAMADAGVLSTDPVTIIGFSQGAMGALAEAFDQRYAIVDAVTFGSPQDLWLPAHVRHVDLAHAQDPVAALAGGGWATSGRGQRDITIRGDGSHKREQYRETARKADASGDPRIEQLHGDWQRFGDAKSAVRRDYELQRRR